jgi:DNA-binding MarR family transcriptional regulator
MSAAGRRQATLVAMPQSNASRAPRIERVVGHKILLLANLLSRGATARYRKLLGLPQVEWRIIALLGNMPPIGLTELAHRAGLDKSQICRGVNNLVRRKLAARSSDPDDSRAIQLSLTHRGGELFEKLIEAAQQRNAFLLGDLPARKRAIFLEAVEQLIVRARMMMELDPEERIR